MDVPLMEADAGDWAYRGEGGANLVLCYRGSSPAFVGKVLRIQKVPRDGGHVPATNDLLLSEHERVVWGDVEDMRDAPSREEAASAFVVRVMMDLLGHRHVDVGVKILVSREFLVTVQNNIAEQRPGWRSDATVINISCDHALLISDHAVFPRSIADCCPCITVEIKPKCGFLPYSEFIAEANAVKKHVSRFRMHQLLKFSKGEVLQPSGYEPVDLFSGNRDQICKAVKALFATPQNNLRVFLNGRIIFGKLGDLDRAVANGKKLEFEESIEHVIRASPGLRLSTFQELVSNVILESGVLNHLLAAQKLDNIDVEGAIHAYYNAISQPCLVCRSINDAVITQRYAPLHSLTLEESAKIVQDYLIAATAKDCSLMISLRPIADLGKVESNTIILESTNQAFEYTASFIDLDLKPLEKMVYYYELDQKIVNLYNKLMMRTDNVSSTGLQ